MDLMTLRSSPPQFLYFLEFVTYACIYLHALSFDLGPK